MPSGAHVVIRPSPVGLDNFSERRREPTRPLAYRDETFRRNFDATTLFFDAFEIAPGEIVLLGPPFLNLSDEVRRTEFFAGSGFCKARVRSLDRHAQIWVEAPPNASRLLGRGPLGDFVVDVAPPGASIFHGRRVIFTASKNNRIEWILDWARFNRDIHGADAILIYDNASTNYDAATLSRALSGLKGISCSAVVEWPFKFGPQGLDAKRFWDSDFCQLGAWEHARWRFLQGARSAMNSDIDELVLSHDRTSVFEAAEKSLAGLVRYYGYWIVGIDGRTPAPREERHARHRDHDVLLRPVAERSSFAFRRPNRCATKWTVAPARCPPAAQWKVHTIGGWWASTLTSPGFSLRHFREIGDNWKYKRTNNYERFDSTRHEDDSALRAACQRVDWER
jgi:hypothetical protein